MSLKSHSRALLLAMAALASGCRAQRELLISSDPPGAAIRLDDQLLEVKTPARIPFKDYGIRRVTLYHEGYMTYSESVELTPPWYGRFPLDFLTEIVIPIGWHDRHRLRAKLVRGDTLVVIPDLVKVMQRAEAMRRAGPEGPRVKAKEVLKLPRETTGVSSPAAPAEKPAAPAKPTETPVGGMKG